MSGTQNAFGGVETNQDFQSLDANILFSGTLGGGGLENAFSNHAQDATSFSGPTEHDNPAEVMFKTQQCRTYTTKGKCPYEYMCMYAHGRDELRTKEMNLRDGLTTAAQVRTYQRQLKASGYSTRDNNGPSSPGFGSPTAFGNGSSFPSSPFGTNQSTAAFPAGNNLPSSPMSRPGMNNATSPTSPFPWMPQQPTTSSPSMHMKGCDCRECRMATAQAAQAQALACPCVECLAAAAAAVAAVTACRLVAARKAQAQAQMCPCPECIAAAQAALTSSATHPCPCPDCATPRGCNDGSSMGAPTSGASTPSITSPVSRLTSRDYMANH